MKKITKTVGWCAVFALWVSGALLLRKIWIYQKSLPDPLGSYIEFSIMFLVTFHVLALVPIKRCVDWFLWRSGLVRGDEPGVSVRAITQTLRR